MASATKKPSSEKELLDWGRNLVEDDERRKSMWYGQIWENIATYMGDFWVEWNPRDRRLQSPPKPRSRARIPINLSQPVIRTELSKLTKNRPITDILARSAEKSDIDSAEVGDKVLNNYVEQEYSMPRVRRRAIVWMLLGGISGIFVDYDETKDPMDVLVDNEGNPVFDPKQQEQWKEFYKEQKRGPRTTKIGRGDLRIAPLSPFEFGWDFSQNYLEDASWMRVTEVYDIVEVERRWNTKVERESDAIPGVIERRMLSRFDRTSKLEMRDPTSQDLCKIHRIFVRPGHPYFPEGQELVFVKEKLIGSEDYPFGHGELPVSAMGHIPLPTGQMPLSSLQQLRGPNLELSKTVSQMVDNRNLQSNPIWRVPEQTGLDESEIKSAPGERLKYRHTPNVPPPEPVPMPDLPGYVKDMPPMMRDFILQISGQGETTQGRVPPGARSGVAIAYLQEEDDTRLGSTVQEYEEAMERANWQILRTIAEKFDLPRTVTIFKKHSEPEVLDFTGNMLAGIGGVRVQAGSGLPRSKAAKQQYVLDLWDRQIERDPRKVRAMLELGEGEPDEWEIDMNQAERENMKLRLGDTQEVPDVKPWYNHDAHLFIHRRFMKSADFEELPDEIQALFEEHVQEHEQDQHNQQYQQMIDQLQAQNFAAAGTGAMGPQGSAPNPPQQNGAAPGPQTGSPTPQGPQGPFASQSPADLMDQTPQ